MELQSLLDLGTDAARRTGELLLERWAGPAMGVDAKSTPTDLVSDADRDAERLLIETITSHRPDDGIVGEEGGRERSRSGVTWILDPLDGTVNFLFGIPAWSVSVAAESEEGTIIGIVYDPVRDELFAAARGNGARRNDSAIAVSERDELETALIGSGFAYHARARKVQAERLVRVLPRVRDIRRAGSAALDLASVACGRLDGFYEAPMETWDKAAGVLLIEEAGGVVSEFGAPYGLSPGVIAAGPRLHDELRALVLGATGPDPAVRSRH